jgi:hypothetical protein
MIGGGLLLIAIGAILRFAITAHLSGISLHTVGVILMVVGVLMLGIGLVQGFGSDSASPSADG